MFLLLPLSILTFCSRAICEDKTLKLVNLLYRHGARSPIGFYPNDPHQEKDWPDGAGRLTQKGMNIEYDLGGFLKQRYVVNMSFIDPMYDHTKVKIRSSSEERCLQSAEVQLAGLFPPQGRQIWNTRIPWQPIPVHTVPKDEDPLLRPYDDVCPRRDELFTKVKASPYFVKKIADSADLFAKMTNYSGMKVTYENSWLITDNTICERTEGFTVPKWIDSLFDQMVNINYWIFQNKYSGGGDELVRLLGGNLLAKIVNSMADFRKNSSSSQNRYKMNIYSGHDSSLLALAGGLDILIGEPVYGSCMMIELYHSSKSGYTVEMFYRNDYSGNLTRLKLKECNEVCALDKFIELTQKRVSRNRSKECDKLSSILTPLVLKILTTVFFISTIMLVYFVICLVLKLRKKKNSVNYEEEERSLIEA